MELCQGTENLAHCLYSLLLLLLLLLLLVVVVVLFLLSFQCKFVSQISQEVCKLESSDGTYEE